MPSPVLPDRHQIGIDADDAVNAKPCDGFGDGGVGQARGRLARSLRGSVVFPFPGIR